MNLSDNNKAAFKHIQELVKQEKGVDLSIAEIATICNVQFDAANFAFKKGIEVRLPVIGSFIRKHKYSTNKEFLELKELEPVLDKEEYKKRLKALTIEISKRKKLRPAKVSFKELINTVDMVKIKSRFDNAEI